jgi:hypothetical protein
MTSENKNVSITPRKCGGWLGIFDDGTLRFGVTARSEEDTERAVKLSLDRWRSVAALRNEADWVREV